MAKGANSFELFFGFSQEVSKIFVYSCIVVHFHEIKYSVLTGRSIILDRRNINE